MSTAHLLELIRKNSDRGGVTEVQLENLNRTLKARLPAEYQDFLRVTDGFGGEFGASYVHLQGTEVLPIMDRILGRAYPNLLLFGTNGGDGYYGFDLREPSRPVRSFWTGDTEKEAAVVASSFFDFLARIYIEPIY